MLIAGVVYLGIAVFLFVLCLILGYVTKRDFIGNGVRLGFLNSILLAIFWPIILLSIVGGWIFDKIMFYKNL